MPRPPRVQVPGGAYHVTARGVAGEAVFADESDRRAFLETLATVVRRYDWSCHAYCVMTTHYHLLVRTPNPDLARGMQRLNSHYAQGFNHRHGRCGHLFGGRYHSVLIQTERHLLELCRYLALNPVRAGLCDDPAVWPWSSYGAVVGVVRRPWFLAVEWLLAHFGTDVTRARERFRAFVHEGSEVTRP